MIESALTKNRPGLRDSVDKLIDLVEPPDAQNSCVDTIQH